VLFQRVRRLRATRVLATRAREFSVKRDYNNTHEIQQQKAKAIEGSIWPNASVLFDTRCRDHDQLFGACVALAPKTLV
jgi:hypothetical protein